MKRITALFLVFVFLAVANTYAGTPAKDINLVLTDLEKAMSGIKTIQTDFIQEKTLSLFKEKIILKGKVFIQKPNLLSWRVFSPMRYSMVIRGATISQWDEDTNQVQRITLTQNPAFKLAIEQMQNWFYGSYKSMLNDYRITARGENPLTLEFVPKETSPAQNFISRILVTFQKDAHYLSQINIEEKSGDTTLLKFVNAKLNKPISPGAWEAKKDAR